MSALLEAIRAHAAANPERIAIDPVSGPPATFAEIADRVEALAARLKREHPAGRPVALQLDYGLDTAILELALLEA